ncbi:hypothetical protein SASPL_117858 [Salvia splendens]|uniref:DEK-C domain-containing protein n=1 Tax=Salvia splendens TaxID=180675 RepID=A0A8X8ZWP8_SALSN|nr:glutamic acid-rich protein-like isoform X2 [Salvia splendens]KAG6421307.1 hypothetical protein SASPL_117858 [Salvia splendens]
MAPKKEQVGFDGSKKKDRDAGKGEDGEKEKSEAKEENAKEGNESLNKRSRKGNKNKAKVVLPLYSSDRPIRQRKTVERFMMGDPPRASPSNTLSIEKGKGVKLKDIPNVAFKLSKAKPDETLQLLHNVLFGKKSTVHTLKKNIGLFSGFVWAKNEKKQRTTVEEKFEKCVKGQLLAFCDILNIPVTKLTTKKELITKLLDFLESPHAATDSLLADMEKKQKLSSQSGKKSKSSIEEEEDNDREAKSSQIDDNHDDDSTVGDGESEDEHHSEEGIDDDDGKVGEGESEEEHHSEEATDDDDSKVGEGESEEEHHLEEANDDDDDSTAGEGESEDEHHSEEGTDDDEDESGKHMDVEQSSSKKRGKKDSGKSELKCNKSVGKGSNVTASKTGKSTQKGKVTTRSSKKKKEEDNGKGMQLKDIPNVAFKLSKTKPHETLQLLHNVLFGKKSKVHTLKKNIGLFSGFVWADNEEKQRTKVKEKFEKCVKEKLLAFCDILDIHVTKSTTKKELITKLLDFLESPHATTDSLPADTEKGKKRKSMESTSKSPTSSNATAGKSKQKQKLSSQSGKKSKPSIEEEEEEDDNDDDSTVGEGENEEEHHSEEATDDDDDDNTDNEGESEEEHHSEEGTDDYKDEPGKHMDVEQSSSKKSSNKSVGKGSNVTASKTGKSTKNPSGSTSKKESVAEPKGKVTTRSSKKKKEEDNDVPAKGASAIKKKSSKSSKKEQGRGKDSIAANKQPSREEMHAAATNILNEVDFDVVKVADVFRQLAKHFGVDLGHRLEEVKEIIAEVMESILKNMSDDSGDETRKDDGDDG